MGLAGTAVVASGLGLVDGVMRAFVTAGAAGCMLTCVLVVRFDFVPGGLKTWLLVAVRVWR